MENVAVLADYKDRHKLTKTVKALNEHIANMKTICAIVNCNGNTMSIEERESCMAHCQSYLKRATTVRTMDLYKTAETQALFDKVFVATNECISVLCRSITVQNLSSM